MTETKTLNALNTTILQITKASMLEKPRLAEQALSQALAVLSDLTERINKLEKKEA